MMLGAASPTPFFDTISLRDDRLLAKLLASRSRSALPNSAVASERLATGRPARYPIYAQAVTWYRKAAEQGVPQARFNLLMMYIGGVGVAPDDPEAVAWIRKAAEVGLNLAQLSLGRKYEDGRGVARDDAQAIAWFRKAAEQGEADAQANLAEMQRQGRGG